MSDSPPPPGDQPAAGVPDPDETTVTGPLPVSPPGDEPAAPPPAATTPQPEYPATTPQPEYPSTAPQPPASSSEAFPPAAPPPSAAPPEAAGWGAGGGVPPAGPPPEAAGWAAGGGVPPAGPPPGASGGGGNKALLVVLGVVGAVLVLSVIAIVLVTVLGSDSDDAATVDRTTLTLSIPDFDAGPTTTDDVSPGDSALNPPTTAAPGGDSIDVFELAVGDCFDVSGSGNISDVEGFDCDQPHDNEVFAVFDIAGGPDAPFPGTPAVEQEAQARCTGTLWTDYVGVPFRQSEFTATSINPTQQTWENLDDREVICVAQSGDGQPLTSSVRGANR